MLSCQRELFSLPDDLVYLNCAYMAPLLRSVEEAGIRGIRRKRAPVELEPGDFFEESDRIRGRFSRLVNASDPGRIAIVPAVSYGAALVARNLELPAGARVVLAGEQFPSNVYPWQRLARSSGADVRMVERPPGTDGSGEGLARAGAGEGASVVARWNDRLLDAIDGDTALVALPQAHWTDGALFDLERIGRRAREVGAALVVDGTQTVGAHPFDVERIRPDALLCAGYKWLLGPYSLGLAYLGPRFDDAEPLEETWIGRAGSEDFAALVDYEDAYRPDASRLDVGERSNFVLVPMLLAALEQLLEWGVEGVAEYCSDLTGRLASGARELGFGALADEDRCANIVGLEAPKAADVDDLVRRLREHRIAVSRRGDSIRVSPHLHCRRDAVDRLLEVLAEARR